LKKQTFYSISILLENDEQWFNWVYEFGELIQERRDVPDSVKKETLRIILDKIIVDYSTVTDLARFLG
jgi:hypothetical protein